MPAPRLERLALLVLVITGLAAAGHADDVIGDPYPLTTCAVADRPLAEAAAPVRLVHEGREIRLCCADCAATFRADPAPHLARLDQAIIEAQRPFASAACAVKRDAGAAGVDAMSELVVGNRLIPVCSAECRERAESAPAEVLRELDAATITRLGAAYPLTTCVVTGNALKDGEAVDVVMHHRLLRVCCPDCVPTLRENPHAALAQVDAATLLTGPPVTLKGVILPTAPAWKPGQPANRMRVAQFTVPGADGAAPAELVVFHFGADAGTREANLQRWIGQFTAPGGAPPEAEHQHVQGERAQRDGADARRFVPRDARPGPPTESDGTLRHRRGTRGRPLPQAGRRSRRDRGPAGRVRDGPATGPPRGGLLIRVKSDRRASGRTVGSPACRPTLRSSMRSSASSTKRRRSSRRHG